MYDKRLRLRLQQPAWKDSNGNKLSYVVRTIIKFKYGVDTGLFSNASKRLDIHEFILALHLYWYRSLYFYFISYIREIHFYVKWRSYWFSHKIHYLGNPTLNGTQKPRGGYPLYKPYRYVQPQRVGVLRRFGLKTSIDFAHFGLESGMVFEGPTGIYERIYRFNSKWIKKSHDFTLLKVYIASHQDASFH